MNRRDDGTPTGIDMCIVLGGLIGLCIAALGIFAGVLWLARLMVGG